jgi:hypothetical protein
MFSRQEEELDDLVDMGKVGLQSGRLDYFTRPNSHWIAAKNVKQMCV